MKHIVLGYKSFGIIPRSLMVKHPEKWEELTPRQMVAVGRLLTDTIDEKECLSVMLDVPINVVNRFDDWQLYNLGCLLAFLREQTPHNRFIIPKIGKFMAPADDLADLSFEDFMFADTFFGRYTETGNVAALYVFVAALYRLHHAPGKRLPWDEDLAEEWADRLANHGNATMEAVAVNYSLVRQWLQKAYPNVFPSASKNDEEGEAKPSKKSKSGGWLEVLDMLVGDDIVNEKHYRQMRVMNVFRFMERKIKENRKRKR